MRSAGWWIVSFHIPCFGSTDWQIGKGDRVTYLVAFPAAGAAPGGTGCVVESLRAGGCVDAGRDAGLYGMVSGECVPRELSVEGVTDLPGEEGGGGAAATSTLLAVIVALLECQ